MKSFHSTRLTSLGVGFFFPRRPVDEHVVVKEGEEFPPVFNETSQIGEEINISYTVT